MGKTVNLSTEWEGRLEKVAEAEHRSAHAIMVEVIEGYITQAEKRAKWRAEIEAARTEYKETGLHVTLDEAAAWMDSWGTDHEQEPPACHP